MVDSGIAYWDSSALIPLFVNQTQSRTAAKYANRFPRMVVWWGTIVEIHTALGRLQREGKFTPKDHPGTYDRLAAYQQRWIEIEPTNRVRKRAFGLPWNYDLRTADALQLAAALEWCNEQPRGKAFISFDHKLSRVAIEVGFQVQQ